MKINFKPFKASHCLRFILLLTPLSIFLNSCNINIPPVDECGNLDEIETYVYLKFDQAGYPERVCPLPEKASDPALVDGTIQSADIHQFWGRIFVEPLCSNGLRKYPYWIRYDPNRMWKIKLPKTRCRVTVEFTEAASWCTQGVYGRPYFEWTKELNGDERTVNADLRYKTTIQ